MILSILKLNNSEANVLFKKHQEGLWSYYIQIEGHSMVRIDSWFEGHSAVRVESWTSTFQNNPIDWTSEHVVIYALVTQQQKVVSGVSPVVHVFGNNSTGNITVSLKESDPSDITNGDGIYSVILTNMPRNSISFSYVVEIIDGSGTVDSGKRKDNVIIFNILITKCFYLSVN